MSKQEARNTAAGMVRDALQQLANWERVQDLRQFENTKEEAARLLDMAETALNYFEWHYDFPQEDAESKLEAVRNAIDNTGNKWNIEVLDAIREIVFPQEESEVTE